MSHCTVIIVLLNELRVCCLLPLLSAAVCH
jgi:hypothetical protein